MTIRKTNRNEKIFFTIMALISFSISAYSIYHHRHHHYFRASIYKNYLDYRSSQYSYIEGEYVPSLNYEQYNYDFLEITRSSFENIRLIDAELRAGVFYSNYIKNAIFTNTDLRGNVFFLNSFEKLVFQNVKLDKSIFYFNKFPCSFDFSSVPEATFLFKKEDCFL